MAKRKREVPRVLNRATISPKQRKNTDILAKQGWVLLKMRAKDERFLKAMQIPLERATYVGSNGTENGEKDKQPAALGVDGGGSGNGTEVSQQLDYEKIRDKWWAKSDKSNKRNPFELPPSVKTTKTTGEWDLSGLNQTEQHVVSHQTKKMQFGKAFHQTGNDRTGRTLLEQGIEHVVEVALRDTMGKFLVDQLVPFHHLATHLATPQVARTDQEKQKIAALPALSLQQTLIIKYEQRVATSLETLIAQCLEVQVADVHVKDIFASKTSREVTYSVGLQNLLPEHVRAVEQKMDQRKLKTQVSSSGRVSDASTPVLSINALKNMRAGDIKAWLETYLDQDLHRDYCDAACATNAKTKTTAPWALTVLVTTACPARLAIVKGSHTGGPGKPFAAGVVDHPDQHEYHIITLPAYSVLVVDR